MSESESEATASSSESAVESPPLPPPPQLHHNRRRDSLNAHYAGSNVSRTERARPPSFGSSYRTPPERRSSAQSSSLVSTMTPEARRQSMIAMDRKRRLTGSGSGSYEQARRRYTPSSYMTRTGSGSAEHYPDPGPRHSSFQSSTSETNSETLQPEVVDLTESSPPPPPPHSPPRQNQPSRTSSSSSRRYIVPPWQPDAEVTHCPICRKQFTWLFRRHHCRKCGRVVCDACSPHRITIPRQFIVNPPRPDSGSESAQEQVDTINLTGEDDEGNEIMHPQSRTRYPSIQGIDGGEKVRLCNPCVPDPQPDPSPNFPALLDNGGLGVLATRFPLSGYQNQPGTRTNVFGQPRPTNNGSMNPLFARPIEYSRQQPSFSDSSGGMARSDGDYSASLGSRPRPSITNPYSSYFPEQDPRFNPRSSTGQNPSAGIRSNNGMPLLGPNGPIANTGPQGPLPHPPGMGNFAPPTYGHGRYQSLDIVNRLQPRMGDTGRPRGSSMFDMDPRHEPSSSSYPRLPPQHQRPRLHERDICPVCRRALPPRGENGDESAREAHIMACISAQDPTSNAVTAGGGSSRGTLHMVSFIASEKDCTGEGSNVPECSICLVEYDVGDELTRLECWCKFHKECITSWLNKKAECPVHKASRFNG